jgi:integrase
MRLRIRYLFQPRGRDGRKRSYYRKAGRLIPLKSPPNDASGLAAEIAAIQAREAKREEGRPKTFGALWKAFHASPEWQALAPRTRRDYEDVADYLAKKIGSAALAEFTPLYVKRIRNIAFKERKRHFANYCLQIMSVCFSWGRTNDAGSGKAWLEANPAAGVEKVAKAKGAAIYNRPWRPEEVEAFMAAAPDHLRLIAEILFWTDARLSDVLRLPWSAWTGDTFEIRQPKTDDIKRVQISKELAAILRAAPRRSPIIAVTMHGQTFTESGFRASFNGRVRRLEKAGALADGCSVHGLRTTGATWLAEGGGSLKQIQAMLGHRSEAAALGYARMADMRRSTVKSVAILAKRRNEARKQSVIQSVIQGVK